MRDLLEAQLDFEPIVVGEHMHAPVLVVGGMGGSALPAQALRFLGSSVYVVMHRDYGVPSVLPEGATCVAISYSGNTEETLSFVHDALMRRLPVSVITSGGTLLEMAKGNNLPYVSVPSGLEPRDALIVLTKALLALIGESELFGQVHPAKLDIEREAEALAERIGDGTPLFYASGRNEALSYIGKIQCNETAKMPAFSNSIPEINHNEMQGFDARTREGREHVSLVAVCVRDAGDTLRIQRRMDLTEQLLAREGVSTVQVVLPQGTRAEALVYGWWLMRSLARTLAERSSVAPDEVPLITAFKAQL